MGEYEKKYDSGYLTVKVCGIAARYFRRRDQLLIAGKHLPKEDVRDIEEKCGKTLIIR